MSIVGDILSTVGRVQYRVGISRIGGYLEYSGRYSVLWGVQ